MDIGALHMAQQDGGTPTTLAAGNAPGESGVSGPQRPLRRRHAFASYATQSLHLLPDVFRALGKARHHRVRSRLASVGVGFQVPQPGA